MKSTAKALGADRLVSLYRQQQVRWGERSWSQEGEDRLLLRFFEPQASGFYVDVGAHHPYRFSNTALLHRLGWRGLNIDAMPGSMKAFKRARPHDINLEIGIAKERGTAQFHVFNEKALNTFDPETARLHSRGSWRVERIIDVQLLPLAEVLDRELAPGQTIDLLTVDAEGRDLQVLESNDWSRWRPRAILAESLGSVLDGLTGDPVARFLQSKGYRSFAKLVNTVMYVEEGYSRPGVADA
ncbi:MAG: FkbM family methyltransferase [Sandaracinobacter sp.]